MPEITVIIPVRNEKKRIRKTVERLLKQDFTDLEVLLVENGSTDGTKEEIIELDREIEKVRSISTGDGAQIGLVRQRGLLEAKGNYICFVDADDQIPERNVISLLYERLTASGGDIAVGNYVRRFGNEVVSAARHGFDENTVTDTEQFRFEAFFTGGTLSYLWGKLYRAAFIRDNGISFSDLEYGEDKQFNLLCYARKPRYVFLPEDVYCYTMNPNSVSHRYHPLYGRNWKTAAYGLLAKMNSEERKQNFSLAAYILLFGVFFDGKQEVEHSRSIGNLHRVMKWYCRDPFVRRLLNRMKEKDILGRLAPGPWKTAMKTLLFMMLHDMDQLMTLGTMGIVTLKIDKKLSSTGR